MHSEYAQTCRARFKAKEKEFFEMDFREDDFDQKTFDFVNRIWGKSESTIIELGCGSGSWTKHLANNGNYVIGVDFSFSSVKELKKKVKGSNIETIVADIEYLPFRGRFADQIFLGWVLHHVTNIGRSVNEAARCLRAEGNIVMVEPNGSNFFRMLTHKIGILLSKGMEKRLTSYEEKPLDVPELCKALRQNGLNFGVFPWDASERTIIRSSLAREYSYAVNFLIKVNVLILKIYSAVFPGILGSSDLIVVAFPNNKQESAGIVSL